MDLKTPVFVDKLDENFICSYICTKKVKHKIFQILKNFFENI